MGLMWKMNKDFPRYVLEGIYILYRNVHQLFTINGTQLEQSSVKRVSEESIITMHKNIHTHKNTREHRRTYFSQTILYKHTNSLTPSYVRILLSHQGNMAKIPTTDPEEKSLIPLKA